MTQFAVLWRDPAIRLVIMCLLLLGVLNSSIYPYQSLIAIERIGLSETVLFAFEFEIGPRNTVGIEGFNNHLRLVRRNLNSFRCGMAL